MVLVCVHVLEINPVSLTHPTKAPRVVLKSCPDFIWSLQLHLTIVSDSLRVLDTVCGVEDFEMHICGQVRGSQFLSQEGCRGSTRAGAEKKNL